MSYRLEDGRLHCFTNKGYGWWRNLLDTKEVRLTLRGRKVSGKPTVTLDEPEVMKAALTDFLIAVPRDAAHAGVALDENKHPVASAVAKAVDGMVYLTIELSE